jgi:hypothetical protein
MNIDKNGLGHGLGDFSQTHLVILPQNFGIGSTNSQTYYQ